jgi:hypothetical protein
VSSDPRQYLIGQKNGLKCEENDDRTKSFDHESNNNIFELNWSETRSNEERIQCRGENDPRPMMPEFPRKEKSVN